ncbi:MAG: tetratricopeptide repeat protein [Elusimicrobia bacterium]|nr:tetratricopeptide repeat protein [Elusimicrobiota bacterium]
MKIPRIRKTDCADYKQKLLIIVLLLSIFIIGCSRQYQAEKAFYWARKYSEDIFKDPKNIPPFKFGQALSNFKGIITRYPQSPQAVEAHLLIANLYLIQEKLTEAINSYRQVQSLYTDNKELQAKVLISIASCYQKLNDWNNASVIFREAFDKYPETKAGLQIPAFLLNHYIQVKDKVNAEKAYQQAVQDYKKLLAQALARPQAAYGAGNMLAECYMRMGDWADLLAILNGMVNKYPQSPEAPVWLMTMGATYDVKLKDKVKAREMYQAVKDKYNQSPWAKEADKRLQSAR